MEDLTITAYLTVPGSELQASFARSGGPGGQNVNKVNSKALLRWDLNQTQVLFPMTLQRLRALAKNRINDEGELVLTCQVHREQSRNLEACREMLRGLLLEAIKPVIPRKPTQPSAGSRRRRMETKRQTGEKKKGRSERWD
jgi:ribosome-associated protein